MPRGRVVLMQQDPDLGEITAAVLELAGYRAAAATSLDDARGMILGGDVGLVLTDYVVADDDASSWQRLTAFRDEVAPVPVALLTGWALSTAEVQRRGFVFYLRKPCPSERLLDAVGAQLAAAPIRDDVERAIRGYFAALERGEYARLAEVCTPDVVYHLPGEHALSGTVRGIDALIVHARGTFSAFREPRMEVVSITPVPRGALVRYRGAWHTADGAPASADAAVLFGLRDGAIASVGIRVDLQTL